MQKLGLVNAFANSEYHSDVIHRYNKQYVEDRIYSLKSIVRISFIWRATEDTIAREERFEGGTREQMIKRIKGQNWSIYFKKQLQQKKNSLS